MGQSEETTAFLPVLPVWGDISNRFYDKDGDVRLTGEKPEDIEILSCEVMKLMDGLNMVDGARYKIDQVPGFIQAVAKDTVFGENTPSVGLKIHLALRYDDPKYLQIVKRVIELCRTNNTEGKPSTFKIMNPKTQKHALEEGDLQGEKSITITPYVWSETKTNVAETVRIVAGLRRIMSEVGFTEQNSGLISEIEHRSGEGIYLRPGQFTEKGYKYQKAGRGEKFDAQLANLDSPETDAEAFRREIDSAVERGEL
jgi:hypothetical protein